MQCRVVGRHGPKTVASQTCMVQACTKLRNKIKIEQWKIPRASVPFWK